MATKKAERQARTRAERAAREGRKNRMLLFWTLLAALYAVTSIPLVLWVYGASPFSDMGLYLILVNAGAAAVTWLAVVGWMALVRTVFGRVARA